jgi:hypothetical protein
MAACSVSAISSGRTVRVEQSMVGAVSWQAAGWDGVGTGVGVGATVGTGVGFGELGLEEPPQPARARRAATDEARRRAARDRSIIVGPIIPWPGGGRPRRG